MSLRDCQGGTEVLHGAKVASRREYAVCGCMQRSSRVQLKAAIRLQGSAVLGEHDN